MGEVTGVQWCDHTFNAWLGCEHAGPGCDHCYAEAFSRWTNPGHWGKDAPRHFFGDAHWAQPEKWNRKAREAGVQRFVFCSSFSDVGEARRDLDQHRARLFELIRYTPNLVWLLLTKRPDHLGKCLPWMVDDSDPWTNVWVGATGENDHWARARARSLRRIRAVRKFMSYEPALGSVDWDQVIDAIDWLIMGGESGAGARESQVEWFRDAVAACRRRGVSPFVKQLGRFPRQAGQLLQLRDRKHGGDPTEWAPDLQVRERPAPLKVAA